ncbi:hypothetical protein CL614_02460 [archaeon]|nr:hypothetical protein [archaeon]|tara:strand:- start:1175 stop:1435 length:261 start_codon:yes stop_codon:yes gene_type:complete
MATEVNIPHPKFFSGKPIKHHIRTFLEQTIDAEWRATCLNDPSFSDWLQQFHLGFMINYMIVAGHFDKEDIITWSNEIRSGYDWKV